MRIDKWDGGGGERTRFNTEGALPILACVVWIRPPGSPILSALDGETLNWSRAGLRVPAEELPALSSSNDTNRLCDL